MSNWDDFAGITDILLNWYLSIIVRHHFRHQKSIPTS